jgi:peptidoglycan hydrolase CwlO-like protein
MQYREWIFAGILMVFLIFLLRNIIYKDYKTQTVTYLTKVGRKDAIDNIIPKTMKDINEERKSKEHQLDYLSSNVTFLLKESKYLRSEINELKKKISSS